MRLRAFRLRSGWNTARSTRPQRRSRWFLGLRSIKRQLWLRSIATFLGLDSTTVVAVKEFVRGGRKVSDENPVMNRLYAVRASVLGYWRRGRPSLPDEELRDCGFRRSVA